MEADRLLSQLIADQPLYSITDFCVCPVCRGDLTSEVAGLTCAGCRGSYSVRWGIPILLPDYTSSIRDRYHANYDAMARDDLMDPLETLRAARHSSLLKFMGSQRGKRVLDIGSSHAVYLDQTEADLKVALDIALPYLEAIKPSARTFRICADAENLPIRPGFFDSIVISDVLEHLLEPQNLVARLRSVCRTDTQIYVHVPWDEHLESYAEDKYEFSHLRSFQTYSFAELWKDFDIQRVKSATPKLEEPLVFQLQACLPAAIYNRLAANYFEKPGQAEKDLEWRRSRLARLPRGEWWLLRFFQPKFKMFQLRIRSRAFLPVSGQGPARTGAADPAQILMLVPHEPDLDPRVKWAADLCASIHPTHVLGVTSSTEKRQREFRGEAFIERVNVAETASTNAQARAQRLGGLSSSGPAVEYISRHGAPPATRSLRGWLRHQLGAAERFVSSLGYYGLIGNSLWRRARTVSVRPAVIVCHDIYALGTALKFKARWGSKVLYDCHEFWPEADLLAQRWEQALTRAYERRLIRRADVVVTVSQPLARHLERTYGLKDVLSVPNACPRDLGVVSSAERRLELPIRVLVQGRAAPRRGFEELLLAWRSFDDQRAILELRCPPSAYLADLKATCRDLERAGRLRFSPPVGEDELIAAAAQADVGLIPYTGLSLNHVFACPNKLSQYMHAGLAILSNDLPNIRSIVEQYQCGLVYDAARPASLGEAILKLVDDLDLLQGMKRASTRAAAESFNWEVQSQPYRDAVIRLASVEKPA